MIRQNTLFLLNYLEAAQTVDVHYLRHVPSTCTRSPNELAPAIPVDTQSITYQGLRAFKAMALFRLTVPGAPQGASIPRVLDHYCTVPYSTRISGVAATRRGARRGGVLISTQKAEPCPY